MMQADDALLGALRALVSALDALGHPAMIIGGIAVIARGVPRQTIDIDAAIAAADLDLEAALTTLAAHHVTLRIENALAFARERQVLLLRHDPTGTPRRAAYRLESGPGRNDPGAEDNVERPVREGARRVDGGRARGYPGSRPQGLRACANHLDGRRHRLQFLPRLGVDRSHAARPELAGDGEHAVGRVARVFNLSGKTAQALAALPYSWAEVTDEVDEAGARATWYGLSDMRLRLSVLVAGAPTPTLRQLTKALGSPSSARA